MGSITEIFYDNEGNEIARYHFVAGDQNRGTQVSAEQCCTLACKES